MIIGIGSKARQGKDTAGEAIVEHFNNKRHVAQQHGYRNDKTFPEARIFKFADFLYQVCRDEYGMKEKDTPLLQKIGNGRRLEFGENYWINKLAAKVLTFQGIAVITDCRYKNEVQWVKDHFGHTVCVSRLNADGTSYFAADRDPNHPSETDLDGYNFDYYIKAKTGDAALVSEQAITLAEYLKGLGSK